MGWGFGVIELMYLSDSSVDRQDGEMSTVPISTNPAGVDDKKK